MSDDWAVLETVESEEEAEVMAGFLESRGLPCRLESTHSHEFPVNVGVLGEVRLLVPAARRAEAAGLLAAGDGVAEGELAGEPAEGTVQE